MTASQRQARGQGVERSREPSEEEGTPIDRESRRSHEQDSDVPLDVTFTILKNERRRRVLKYVLDAEGRVTLSDVAEHVAAIENDTTPARLGSQQRKRVYIGLYQSHLPKMDDAGVIEFDRDRGVCEVGPNAAAVSRNGLGSSCRK